MDGVLVIDKPVGPTSHDVVARVRRAIGERRIGHTGTLDPGASGVLPLVIGRATRLARFLSAGDKSYDAIVRLGFSTDTGDAEGAPLPGEPRSGPPSAGDVESALDAFRGTFSQQPPAYSAKKINGTRSYRIARHATRESTENAVPPSLPAPVEVTAHVLELVSLEGDRLTLRMTCSAGFYVRSLARDLGERLGVGGHVVGLRRTRSAEFELSQATPLDVVERDRDAAVEAIVPLAAMLPALASVALTAGGAERAAHGRDLGPADFLWGPKTAAAPTAAPIEPCVRLLDEHGRLVGIARAGGPPGVLHPFVVLV